MDNISIGVEFPIDNPRLKSEAQQAKSIITGVGDTAGQSAARANANINSLLDSQSQGYAKLQKNVLQLKVNMEFYRALSEKSLNPADIEKYNIKIRELGEEIARIRNMGVNAKPLPDLGLENQDKQVKKITSSYNGLNNSVAQITRELPAFTYSAQTGFMAISNNIPIFVDQLSDAVRKNKELIESGQKAVPVWKQFAGALFSFNTVISVLITLFTVFGKEIGEWVKALFRGKDAMEAFKKSQQNLIEVNKQYQISLQQEVSKLQTLIAIASNEKLSREERTDAVRRLNKLMPEHLGNITLETLRTRETTAAIEEYIKVLKRKSFEEAVNSKRQDIYKQRIELQTPYNEAKQARDKAAIAVKNQKYKIPGSDEETATEAIAKKRQKEFEEFVRQDQSLIKQSIDLDNQLQSFLEKQPRPAQGKKDRYYFQQIIDDNQRLLDGLDKSAVDFKSKSAEYKRNILEAQKNLSDFSVSDPAKDAGKMQKDLDHIAIIYDGALTKLSDLKSKYSRKALGADDEEVKTVEAEFETVKKTLETANKKIIAYNNTHSKKVKLFDVAAVDSAQKQAVDDVVSRQAIGREKNNIEQLKQVYAQYEQYKTEYGKQEADKRFKDDLKGYTDYVSYVQSQLDSLTGKTDVGSNALRDFFNSELPKARRDASNKTFDDEMKNLKRVLDATKTAKSEELRINEQYDKDLVLLRKKYVGEELQEREKALAENRRKELQEVETQFSVVSKMLSSNINNMSQVQLRDHITRLKKELERSGIPEGIRRQIMQGIDGATDLIKSPALIALGVGNGNLSSLLGNGMSGLVAPLKIVEAAAGNISQDFGKLSSVLEGVNDGLAYTLGSISEIVGTISDVAGSLAKGDILGAVTSIATGWIGMNKKVKQMNAAARAEQKKFYDEAIKGEAEYQALLRKRELDDAKRGKTTYQGIISQLEVLKEQAPELQKAYDKVFKSLQGQDYVTGVGYQHGTWFRKAKTWDILASLAGSGYDELEKLDIEGRLTGQSKTDFDELKRLREELKQAGLDVQDLQQQLKEMLTGTSVEGLSDALADLFENGKLAAKDFGDTFESIVGKAILNSFKYSVIEKAMGPLFDQLTAMTAGGKIPGASEVQDFIEAAKKIGESLGGQWQAITDGLTSAGLDIFNKGSSANQNSLTGAYSTASQESINLLAGQTAGMRLAQLEGNVTLKSIAASGAENNALMRDKLLVLKKIENNTFKTAENTNRLEDISGTLESIERKLSGDDNARRAAGF